MFSKQKKEMIMVEERPVMKAIKNEMVVDQRKQETQFQALTAAE